MFVPHCLQECRAGYVLTWLPPLPSRGFLNIYCSNGTQTCRRPGYIQLHRGNALALGDDSAFTIYDLFIVLIRMTYLWKPASTQIHLSAELKVILPVNR